MDNSIEADVQQTQEGVVLTPTQDLIDQNSPENEHDRKLAKMSLQAQKAQQFIVTIFRGLSKIIQDVSSQIIKR